MYNHLKETDYRKTEYLVAYHRKFFFIQDIGNKWKIEEHICCDGQWYCEKSIDVSASQYLKVKTYIEYIAKLFTDYRNAIKDLNLWAESNGNN